MSEADRITAHAKVRDHVAEGLALLTRQFRGRPAIEGLLGAWTEQVQALEDALWQLLTETSLDSASTVGAQLDVIGSVLDEPRDGLEDTPYRTVLRAKALALRSSGTVPNLLALADLLIPEGFELVEYFPAAIAVEASAPVALSARRVLALLRLATAGGVGVHMLTPPGLPGFPGDAFEFASGELVETDAAHGWSDVLESTGGALAGALE